MESPKKSSTIPNKNSHNWTPERISKLISQGKSEELHWFPEGESVSNLSVTMVGMANTAGGTLIIGVSPRSGRDR